MANFFTVNGLKDWNMPFDTLPLVFKVCDKECRKGKMGTWLDPIGSYMTYGWSWRLS